MNNRKTPTCGCCGLDRVKGHSKVCPHDRKTCRKCLAEAASNYRRRDLIEALDRVGCKIRSDSKLCQWFIEGCLAEKTGGRFSTADSVARRMAEVRYLREGYCKKLNKKKSELEGKIEDMVDFLAEMNKKSSDCPDHSDWEGHYRGIWAEACNEVSDYDCLEEFEDHMIETWEEFPVSWPWMQD